MRGSLVPWHSSYVCKAQETPPLPGVTMGSFCYPEEKSDDEKNSEPL